MACICLDGLDFGMAVWGDVPIAPKGETGYVWMRLNRQVSAGFVIRPFPFLHRMHMPGD